MGGVSYEVASGRKVKDLIAEYLTNDAQCEIIDLSVKGNIGYTIVRTYRGVVIGAVVKTERYTENGRTYFYVKDMSESMGPCYYDAPARLLDKLDELVPEPESYGREWRDKCRATIAKRKEASAVKAGDLVVFSEPMRFGDGFTRSEFYFVKGSTFRATDGVRVSITRWKDRAYSVKVPATA